MRLLITKLAVWWLERQHVSVMLNMEVNASGRIAPKQSKSFIMHSTFAAN